MPAGHIPPMDNAAHCPEPLWFAGGVDLQRLRTVGFRPVGGGVHQTKTMMLRELTSLLDAAPTAEAPAAALASGENALGKATGSARRLTSARLRALYGLGSGLLIARLLVGLWQLDPEGRPLMALLTALARDPLLRASATVVLPAAVGTSLRWPAVATHLGLLFPERFSPKMLKSLAQNCASSWTQSGHLRGKIDKRRAVASPTPATAAYAAALATLAGFGGPALLESPWMAVLDRPVEARLALLRAAQAQGLARVRAAGDMVEVAVRQSMAQTIGVPELGGA